MRYYAISRADSLAATSGLSMFSRLLHNWRARRRLAKLTDLDDRLLDDIGLKREEFNWALNLPLTVNPAEELEQRAFRRRLEEARKRPGWGVPKPYGTPQLRAGQYACHFLPSRDQGSRSVILSR